MANKKPTKKIVTNKHQAREQREARQTRLILIISIAVGVIVLGLVAFGIIDQTIIRPRTPVARVGDTNITVRQFESYVQYTRVQMLNQSYQYYTFHQQFGEFGGNFLQTAQTIAMELTQPVSLGRTVLDEMINNLIIKEEAAKRDITVSESEIDEAIQAAFGFFPDGTPTPTVTATILPTPTYSETQLALINTPTAIADEVDSVENEADETPLLENDESEQSVPEASDDFITPEDEETTEPELATTPEATPTVTLTPTPYTTALFAQNIRDFERLYAVYNFDLNNLREIFKVQLLREKLIEAVELDVEITKNEVWARHILVAEEDYDLALEILSRLDEGENFIDLAAIYSIDDSNKDRGGDLGWFDENTMVAEFAEAAFSLGEGEISEPVQTTFGYHIIQVLGKRESQVLPAQILQQRQQAFSSWLTEQRNSRDDIEIFDRWDQFVPTTPEVPQQFLIELYQQPQQ
jgi:foldase protein PrsA